MIQLFTCPMIQLIQVLNGFEKRKHPKWCSFFEISAKVAVKAKKLRCFVCFAVGQVLSKKIYRERLTRVYKYKYENTYSNANTNTNMKIHI